MDFFGGMTSFSPMSLSQAASYRQMYRVFRGKNNAGFTMHNEAVQNGLCIDVERTPRL